MGNGGEYRNRTGVHGFAIRCVTTPPTRRSQGAVYYMIWFGASALVAIGLKTGSMVFDAVCLQKYLCETGAWKCSVGLNGNKGL